MTLNRYAKRRDANEGSIIAALQNAGVWVVPLSQPVDLLCWHRGRFFLVEVKNPARHRPDMRTPAQRAFFRDAKRLQAPVYLVESVSEALEIIWPALPP